jgi:hypothetical protein
VSDGAVSDGAVSDGADSEPESSPLRRALDIFVFAPVGVALTVAEDLPALIVKGRQRFESDVRNARILGQFVVTHGQRDVVGRVSKLLHGAPPVPTTEAPKGPVAVPAPDSPANASTSPTTAPEAVSHKPAPTAPAPSPKPPADPADALAVDAALAGYDTLSASQVVRRLESLGPDELRAVHRHESSHRNRRTILNRAQQLLEGAGPDRPVG